LPGWFVRAVPVLCLLLASLTMPATNVAAATPTSLQLSPTSQALAIGDTATVTAIVLDGNNNPIDGVQVTFTLLSGPNTFTTTVATTGSGLNPHGEVSIQIYGGTGGTDQIGATATNNLQATATVTWGSTAAEAISISPQNVAASVGTSETFTATVTDLNLNPVAGAYVTFTVTGVNNNQTSTPILTDFNGQATFSYTSSFAETDTVTASTPGVNPSATATVVWGAPSNVTLSPTSLTAVTGSPQFFTATVRDVSGNPIANTTVTFTVTGANTTSGNALTNSSGQAAFSYTGATTGTDSVTASSGGATSATTIVTWLRGPLSITLATSSTSLSTGSTATVTATVRDGLGNLVIGVPVHFVVTGANATSGGATTNTAGQTSLSYVGVKAGTDTVTAFPDLNNNAVQDTGEPSATATIGWSSTPGLMLAASASSPAVGSSESITATLTNPGSSVNNVVIHFTISGVDSQTGTAVTNGSGQATLSYTGANAGTDTITAYADLNNNSVQDSGEPSASVSVNWGGVTTPTPPPTPFAPAQPTTARAGCTFFAVTGHNLCAGFQSYWNKFGGLAIYGYPLTEEFVANGVTTQYFERARFEWHPGTDPSHFDVLLGLVGDEVTAGRATQAPFVPTAAKAGCTYFAATGHNLCAGFAAYWNQFGGLAAYGMPISEEFQEKNPDTGQVYTVQYFERARFEWHPGEDPVHFDVELGRLGTAELQGR